MKELPEIPPTPVRALIRLLLRGEEVDRKWIGLETHYEELREAANRWNEILVQARASVKFSGCDVRKEELAVRALCCVSLCNIII